MDNKTAEQVYEDHFGHPPFNGFGTTGSFTWNDIKAIMHEFAQHQTEALREENEKLIDHNKYLQTLQQNQADVIRNFHNVMQEHFGLFEFHSTDLDKHIRQFKSELTQLRADNERMRAALTDLQDQAWRNGIDYTTVHEKCKQALTPKD